MKHQLVALLVVLCMLCSFVPASAGGMEYIIPDSNTRYLTEYELWQWSYESLGFIFNEIFARHGYNFEVGGKYYNYFMSRPWYTPNANPNNTQACYPQLSNLEWANEELCKAVRKAMLDSGTRNTKGKNYLDYVGSGAIDILSGFYYASLKTGQKLPVYSAPNGNSWRGANGKASVSTNGAVYVAGWESGWLLVMYETNNGAVRVGYVSNVSGNVQAPRLNFAYQQVALNANASLTDDPVTTFTTIRQMRAGETVTYLTTYQNRYSWAYVETYVNGQTVRGFIPAEALDMYGLD